MLMMVKHTHKELTNAICDAADVGRQEAARALLVHLGTRRHTINSNQHHTPGHTGSSSSSSRGAVSSADVVTQVCQNNCCTAA